MKFVGGALALLLITCPAYAETGMLTKHVHDVDIACLRGELYGLVLDVRSMSQIGTVAAGLVTAGNAAATVAGAMQINDDNKEIQDTPPTDDTDDTDAASPEKRRKTLNGVQTYASAPISGGGLVMFVERLVSLSKQKNLPEARDACVNAATELNNKLGQARVSNTASEREIALAQNVVNECQMWEMVDFGKIKGRSTGATVATGVAAGTGVAGGAVAMVNHDETDPEKRKKRNVTSTVLNGTATVAGGAALAFSISELKEAERIYKISDACIQAIIDYDDVYPTTRAE